MIMIFSVLTRRSGNRFKCLSTSECGDSELCEAFEGIKELYFDDTIMTWEDVWLSNPSKTRILINILSFRLPP